MAAYLTNRNNDRISAGFMLGLACAVKISQANILKVICLCYCVSWNYIQYEYSCLPLHLVQKRVKIPIPVDVHVQVHPENTVYEGFLLKPQEQTPTNAVNFAVFRDLYGTHLVVLSESYLDSAITVRGDRQSQLDFHWPRGC